MRKSTWALLFLAAMVMGAMGILIAACGETDPALAPAGSVISILGAASDSLEIECDDRSKMAYTCYDVFYNTVLNACVKYEEGMDETACEANYSTMEEKYGEAARDAIAGTEAGCGYYVYLLMAFVQDSSTSTETTTKSVLGVMNDIEVRFVAYNGSLMYKLSDNPDLIDPLANPYITRTDDRGKAEIKYLVPKPISCGTKYSYSLAADIGVALATFDVEYTVGEFEESDTTTDDDDDATE